MASLCVLFERPVASREIAGALGELAPEPPEVGAPGVATGEARVFALAGLRLEVAPLDERAAEVPLDEAVTYSNWPGAAEAARRHRALVRVRAIDAGATSAVEVLRAISRAAGALLTLPGALALLDEEGRALSEPVAAARRLAGRLDVPPLDLWIAVRAFQLEDADGWFLDTIGMSQFGLPDLEAYSGAGTEVADWLRNIGLHLVEQVLPLGAGDTLDGPDEEPWITIEDTATVEPARPVLRFAPM